MNLVQVQNRLRGLSDQQLQQAYMQNSGEVPPFLVLAESKRRQDMRQAASQQQTTAQAQQPSVAEQIMVPPQQSQGAAPAQGAPMGQAGMPQMQAPPQGGIQAFREGGAVRGYAGGGLIPYGEYRGPGSGREGGGIAALLASIGESIAGDAPAQGEDEELDLNNPRHVMDKLRGMFRAKEAPVEVAQADVPRKTAADYPVVPGPADAPEAGIRAVRPAPVARPAAPASPVPTAAQPTPSAGIAALPATPEMQGPPSPSPLEALRNQAQMVGQTRPKALDMYEQILKGAPEPGANLKTALEKQQGTLDQRLQEAKGQRLQNFFLNLAAGQSQNALTNIGGALKTEAEGFNKVSADVAKQRDELLFKLAEAQDSGDEKVYNRTLKKLEVLALDNAGEDALRKELATIEAAISTARTADEKLALEKRKELVAERLKTAETKYYEARAAGATSGKSQRSPEQVNRDVVAAVKSVQDTIKTSPQRIEMDSVARAAGFSDFITAYEDMVRKAFAAGRQQPSMQEVITALRKPAAPAGGRGPKALSITEVK